MKIERQSQKMTSRLVIIRCDLNENSFEILNRTAKPKAFKLPDQIRGTSGNVFNVKTESSESANRFSTQFSVSRCVNCTTLVTSIVLLPKRSCWMWPCHHVFVQDSIKFDMSKKSHSRTACSFFENVENC